MPSQKYAAHFPLKYSVFAFMTHHQIFNVIINFSSKNETVNVDRYIEMLEKLKEKIRFKIRGL
jgi:hypothetical protein